MKKLPSLLTTLLLTATLHAQSPTPLTQDQLSATLSPFLDNQSLLIAHADTARIDLPAAQKFLDQILVGQTLPKDISAEIFAARLAADAYLSKFQSAGGRHVFFLLSHADLWPFTEPPVCLLIPLDKNTDPKPMIEFLHLLPTSDHASIELLPNNSLFFGTASSLAHLKSLTPTPRPDLLAPFTDPATSNATLQIVYAQTPDIRRAFAEIAPRFPAGSPVFPNESTDFLSRGLNHISLSLTLPPNPSISLTFATRSPDDANKITTLAKAYLDLAVADPDYQKEIKNPRAEDKPALIASQLFLKYLYESLSAPNSTANFTTTLDAIQLKNLFQLTLPLIAHAQTRSAEMESMTHIRQLVMGCIMYADQNKGVYPASLDLLAPNGYTKKDFPLTNPADPQHRPYVYHPWSPEELKKLTPATTPLIWETTDDNSLPLNVGFLDGHVEHFPSKQNLTTLLDAAKEKIKAP